MTWKTRPLLPLAEVASKELVANLEDRLSRDRATFRQSLLIRRVALLGTVALVLAFIVVTVTTSKRRG